MTWIKDHEVGASVRLIVLALIVSATAVAQSDRGTITGTVTDAGEGVVPGATVLVINTGTGAEYNTITTVTGNFSIAQLPVGTYDLSVESAGFKRHAREGLRVQVAQVTRLDIVLEIGTVSESVAVTAEDPLLRTENAEQSINVRG